MPNMVLVDVHQLSRRFDALVWFVRLQRLEYDLNRFRCVIPISGPSTVETLPDSTAITSVLEGYTNSAPATLVPWQSHLDYQETLSSWQKRHSLQWTSSASISWILALSRPSWLAMAQIGLQDPLTTCLLHALGAISTSDMDTLSIPPPARWLAPVWVLSALTTTSHWPAMMCQLQQTAQDVPSVSRLDCAWAPEASWQWRCVTQGPLRGILSDDAAFDALDALRFSPHMNERTREMVEDYFKAEYPGLEQRCVVAFSLGGPIGSPKEKPWIQPLPALESEP